MKKLFYSCLVFVLLFSAACTSNNCDERAAPLFREYGRESQVLVYEDTEITLAPAHGIPFRVVRWDLPNGESVSDTALTVGPMKPEMSGSYTMSLFSDGCWISRSIILNSKSLKPDCDVKKGYVTFISPNGSDFNRFESQGSYLDPRGFTNYSFYLLGGQYEFDFTFTVPPEPGEYEVWRHLHSSINRSVMSINIQEAFGGSYYPYTTGSGVVLVRRENGKLIIRFCDLHFKSTMRNSIWQLNGEVVLEE